jgi:hypothetical protein
MMCRDTAGSYLDTRYEFVEWENYGYSLSPSRGIGISISMPRTAISHRLLTALGAEWQSASRNVWAERMFAAASAIVLALGYGRREKCSKRGRAPSNCRGDVHNSANSAE